MMLDETTVKVYKFIILNSSERTYRGTVGDIASITGLSAADVFRALQVLEQEKLIQVSYLDSSTIFKNIFDELFSEEAHFIENLNTFDKNLLEKIKKDIGRLKELAAKYAPDADYEKVIKIDIERLANHQNYLAQDILSVLHFSNPSLKSPQQIGEILDEMILHLKKINLFIRDRDSLSEEDLSSISAHLSLYISIPRKKIVTVKKGAQNILKSLESLQESLEIIEMRIFIEGSTPELIKLKNELVNQIASLNQLLTSLREEKEVFVLSKDTIKEILDEIPLRKRLYQKIFDLLDDTNPFEAKLKHIFTKILIFVDEEEKLLNKVAALML